MLHISTSSAKGRGGWKLRYEDFRNLVSEEVDLCVLHCRITQVIHYLLLISKTRMMEICCFPHEVFCLPFSILFHLDQISPNVGISCSVHKNHHLCLGIYTFKVVGWQAHRTFSCTPFDGYLQRQTLIVIHIFLIFLVSVVP